MKKQDKNFRQRGITLVMALLLTSAVIASSLIVASILVRELRLTDNMRQSLVAYYGAESGLESILYSYYKENGSLEPPGGAVGLVADWRISTDGNSAEVLKIDLPWETSQEIPLYKVDKPDDVFPVAKIEINLSPGVSLSPEAIEYTLLTQPQNNALGGFGLEPGPRGLEVTKKIVSFSGDGITIKPAEVLAATGADPNGRHILRFKHIGVNGYNQTFPFVIRMWDASGEPIAFNQNMLYKIVGTTKNKRVSRALTVGLNLKPPAYDVFDYVIFSDAYVSRDYLNSSLSPGEPPTQISPIPTISLSPVPTIVNPTVIKPPVIVTPSMVNPTIIKTPVIVTPSIVNPTAIKPPVIVTPGSILKP